MRKTTWSMDEFGDFGARTTVTYTTDVCLGTVKSLIGLGSSTKVSPNGYKLPTTWEAVSSLITQLARRRDQLRRTDPKGSNVSLIFAEDSPKNFYSHFVSSKGAESISVHFAKGLKTTTAVTGQISFDSINILP
uniref:Uncharacterized protein n=1 Tax=Megaselia scalaris TaxID=36166 RepID=T1GMT3_MEGSC